MEKQVQKYEPMMICTLKNGRNLVYPKSKDPDLQASLATSAISFVKIEGKTVNKWEISLIEDLPEKYDLLIGLDEEARHLCMERFQKIRTNLGREPTRIEKNRIKEKVLNPELYAKS